MLLLLRPLLLSLPYCPLPSYLSTHQMPYQPDWRGRSYSPHPVIVTSVYQFKCRHHNMPWQRTQDPFTTTSELFNVCGQPYALLLLVLSSNLQANEQHDWVWQGRCHIFLICKHLQSTPWIEPGQLESAVDIWTSRPLSLVFDCK